MKAHGLQFQGGKFSNKTLATLLFILFLSAFSQLSIAQQASDSVAPEFGFEEKSSSYNHHEPAFIAKEYMAVTAHPLATKSAIEILKAGGTVIDAMVAVQTVLGLVEPQSSGLGGGAFALYYDAKTKKLHSFDGRETAPFTATPDLFMSDQTTPMQFFEAVVGGRSVGTPGTVKLLWELHKKYGNQKWAELLKPAIELAETGFHVTPRLAASVKKDQSRLVSDNDTAAYFLPNGSPIETGYLLKNSDYAQTLQSLAKHGGDYFYDSEISKAIVKKINDSKNKGFLSQKDFNRYKIIERPASCADYKEFSVCGMGPPSSGALTINQILGILENYDLASRSSNNPITWQIIAEASRLSFADRGQYIADPDFFKVPTGLTDKAYLKQRSNEITLGKVNISIAAGAPPDLQNASIQTGNSPEQESTTHFVIVDKQGNILSMTSTIENAFGSRLMVKGFLLNNELTDFSFLPNKDGKNVANRVEPGKRPRSSMAPTIVFKNKVDDTKEPYIALGSPGGSRIINFVANTLISVLDWQEDLQTAINKPHIINRFGKMELEENTKISEWDKEFQKMGYPVTIQNINSGLHGVMFTKSGMIGAADKRREGLVLGK